MVKKYHKIKLIKLVMLLPFLLAGCASTKWLGAETKNKTNPAGDLSVEGAPVENDQLYKSQIEYKYVPIPIPGQLMAIPPLKNSVSKKQKGIKATSNANKKAIQEPKSDQFFNSLLTYVYMPGAVYTIYTAAGKITDIELEKDEKILNIATGDSANWQIQTSPSGTNHDQILHILVKPMITELSDNTLVILTDKRTYHLYLKITSNNTFMVSVKWNYPNNKNSLFIKPKNTEKNKQKETTGDYTDPSAVVFNYQWAVIQGDKPEWLPEQVFHDERKTYIRFPDNFNNQISLPILYIPDGNGGFSTMTNWRLLNKTTMAIDGILKHALLKTGSVKGKRVVVKIRMVQHEKQ